MKKTWGVECAVKWCVCLTKAERQYCAVHAKRGKDYHVGSSSSAATLECDECDGTGECPDCDGEGTHQCGHDNCNDEHDCGSCDATGECSYCADSPGEPESFDARYIAFAFDAGWVPPVPYESPWETA